MAIAVRSRPNGARSLIHVVAWLRSLMVEGYRSRGLLWAMAYDEALAQRISDVLEGEPGLTSRKMFGGLGYMLDGHMAVAAGSGGALMVRIDPADAPAWVDGEGVTPMKMRGREMAGWLLVSSDALTSDEQLELWVGRGVAFVRALPPR
ncbi:hypothetical protein GCM10009797_26600 [Nocardioides hwasunensis]